MHEDALEDDVRRLQLFRSPSSSPCLGPSGSRDGVVGGLGVGNTARGGGCSPKFPGRSKKMLFSMWRRKFGLMHESNVRAISSVVLWVSMIINVGRTLTNSVSNASSSSERMKWGRSTSCRKRIVIVVFAPSPATSIGRHRSSERWRAGPRRRRARALRESVETKEVLEDALLVNAELEERQEGTGRGSGAAVGCAARPMILAHIVAAISSCSAAVGGARAADAPTGRAC